ncbi:hypothetical protein SAMN05216525_127100 [Bradyrhizobium sp. Gha]|nr:hypothetical protein SAMN05216525_127100 [Bradyrhizobium sp. Gha]
MTPDDLDKAALELAMQMAPRLEAGRGAQLDAMLAGGEPWLTVAQFAAYCCQTENLHLKPWETPPVWIDDPDDPDAGAYNPQPHDGRREAAKLRRQMRKLGISEWHPDPIAAIEAAKCANEKG